MVIFPVLRNFILDYKEMGIKLDNALRQDIKGKRKIDGYGLPCYKTAKKGFPEIQQYTRFYTSLTLKLKQEVPGRCCNFWNHFSFH